MDRSWLLLIITRKNWKRSHCSRRSSSNQTHPPYAVVAGAPAKIIACRFTIEQILLHEASLYPPEERMSKESLEELFKNHYEGKRHIGTHEIEEIKVLNIKKIKEQNKIPVYDE